MGKKLDALLGRSFETSKFKTLVNLVISRLAVLKNQRQVRCSHTRSDVAQLLHLDHQERALLRVEHVIKEQNMLDVFVMIEGYCYLLIERVIHIENNKECPEELKEAISSLIFAASRCGEFPELQEIHHIFKSRFGKEFAARAIELRNNCGVNPKMVQKLSTRQPNLESRLKVLREIASENRITLHLEEESSLITEQKPIPSPCVNLNGAKLGNGTLNLTEQDEQLAGSIKAQSKYRDVVSAAQAAFESAVYAAAAARVAVELSRSESRAKDPDDESSPAPQHRSKSDDDGSLRGTVETAAGNAPSRDVEDTTSGAGFKKMHPVNYSGSKLEGDELKDNPGKIHAKEFRERKTEAKLERLVSSSSSDSIGNTLENKICSNQQRKEEMVFYESDHGTMNEQGIISWSKQHHLRLNRKSNLPTNESPKTLQSNTVMVGDLPDKNEGVNLHYPSQNQIPLRSQADPHKHININKLVIGSGNKSTHHMDSEGQVGAHHSNIERKPVSVRTRRVHR